MIWYGIVILNGLCQCRQGVGIVPTIIQLQLIGMQQLNYTSSSPCIFRYFSGSCIPINRSFIIV